MSPLKKRLKTELQKQTELWYSKLKKTGFKDIEQDEYHLKFWDTGRLNRKDPNMINSTQSYYTMAEHFLNDHTFDNNSDRIIWEYHANGISARNITKTLNKVRKVKTNRTTVLQILKKLRDKMKLLYNVSGHGETLN